MSAEQINSKGEPIRLKITNFHRLGGSLYELDMRVEAPGIEAMLIQNPMSMTHSAIVDLSSSMGLKNLHRLRIGEARPRFIFTRTKLKSVYDHAHQSYDLKVVQRREIYADLDLTGSRPRITETNAEVRLY